MIYSICPTCLRVCRRYKTRCRYDKTALIPVHIDLVKAVKKLLEHGFKVIFADCETFNIGDMTDGQIDRIDIHITIELGDHYPDGMYYRLPDGWMIYEYNRVVNDTIGAYVYHGLACVEHYPVGIDADEIEYARMLTISNLESWLDSLSIQGFRAVWVLGGGPIKL